MQPLTDDERTNLRGSLTTLRIIVFALMTGVTCFAVFSVYSQFSQPDLLPGMPGIPGGPQQPVVDPAGPNQTLHLAAIAFAAVAAMIAFVAPPFIPVPKMETDKTDPREVAIVQAAGAVQMRTIIACALLEGAAFFNTFWVLTDFSLPNLAMVGVLLFLLALHFPLAGWYYGKVERLMGVDPFESLSAYAPRKNNP